MKPRSFLEAASGPAFAQLVALVCLPILFRLYGPNEFGVWAIAQAIALLLGGVATFRYELAIVLEKKHSEATAAFWGALFCAIFAGLVLCILVHLFIGELAELTKAGELSDFAQMISVWILAMSAGQAAGGWLMRGGRFFAIAQMQIVAASVSNCMQIFLALVSAASSTSLVLGSLLGQLCATIWGYLHVYRARDDRPGRIPNAVFIKQALKKHYRFPVFLTPYTIVSVARERMSIIVLALFVSPYVVGLFSQAWRLVHLPVGLVGTALRPVVYHAAVSQGGGKIERKVSQLVSIIGLMGVPMCATLILVGGDLLSIVLGEDWRASAPYVSWLAIPALLFAMVNWTDRLFDVADQQRTNLVLESAVFLSSIVVLWLALAIELGPEYSVGLFAVTLTIGYAARVPVVCIIMGFGLRFFPILIVQMSLLFAVSLLLVKITDSIGGQMYDAVLALGVASALSIIVVGLRYPSIRQAFGD